MYLKSTSFSAVREAADLKDSHLVFFDREGMDYQFIDIKAPFMLLYEAVDLQSSSTVYMEFSEEGALCLRTPYEEYRKFDRRLHSHNFYEVTYVLSGHLTMHIEDETVGYEPGECCVCNKNIHHVEVMDEDTELLLLLLKEDYLKMLLSDELQSEASPEESVFSRFFAENRRSPFYDAKVYADFRAPDQALRDRFLRLVNQLIVELSAEHLGKRYMVQGLLCRFLELLERSSAFRSEVHSARLSREEQVVYQIARAYRKRSAILSREEVEQLTGYCSDHVERIVKRHLGMTLSEYGRLFLLQKAATLLKESDKGVGEICEELGYANRTYFNRIFRERYGLTPAAYRRQHRA